MPAPPLLSASQSLWIIVASLLFTAMGVCVKQAAQYMNTFELVFYRSLFGCLMIAAIAGFRTKTLRTSNFSVHCYRGIFGFISLLLFFYAIPRISLSLALALLKTSSLFLVLLYYISLRKRPSLPLVAMLLISFIGMLFVLQPQQDEEQWLSGIAALGAGCAAGCAYYNIRRLGVLQEGGVRTVFYFTLLCTVLSALALLFSGSVTPFSGAKMLWALIIAVTASAGQLALTRGLHYGQTVVSSSLMYSSIIFSGILDYLLWQNVPNAAAWFGIVLISGGSIGALIVGRAAAQRQ